MNTLWMAVVALWVLAEKALPWGSCTARLTGAVLVAWGSVSLAIAVVLSKKSICADKHSTEPPGGRAWRMYKFLDAVYRGRNAR